MKLCWHTSPEVVLLLNASGDGGCCLPEDVPNERHAELAGSRDESCLWLTVVIYAVVCYLFIALLQLGCSEHCSIVSNDYKWVSDAGDCDVLVLSVQWFSKELRQWVKLTACNHLGDLPVVPWYCRLIDMCITPVPIGFWNSREHSRHYR